MHVACSCSGNMRIWSFISGELLVETLPYYFEGNYRLS